jgi:streptomycin 6-kinase
MSSDSFDLVPAGLPVVTQLAGVASAREWLAALPSLIVQVRDEFGVRLAPPLHGGSCSWVAPAELPGGRSVVVKIGWPHPEMYGEAAALRAWDGRGAVELLAHDPGRHALLLHRCAPGDQLGAWPAPAEEVLRAGCRVLRELWQVQPPAAGDIASLGAVTAAWADLVEDRMDRIVPGYDAGVVAEGVRLLRRLPGSAPDRVLLHGDFNPGNVLRDGGRWLAIDPKPMIGDPGYDPWPLLEQVDDPFAHPDPAGVLRSRLELMTDELGVGTDRIVGWAVARRVETALWAAEHGDVPGGADLMRDVPTLLSILA